MISRHSLDLAEARRMAEAACAAAAAQQAAVSIAVVDEGGELVQFVRMDTARGYTAELATRKARLAARVGAPSRAVTEAGRQSFGAATGEAAAGAGGIPVVGASGCIGAVGVSGARPEIDEMIAAAAIAALD